MAKDKSNLNVDLRNATKGDMLNLSNSLRVISWIHETNYSSNVIFLLSIISGVLIGILMPLILNLYSLSKESSILFIWIISSLLIILLCFIIYQIIKSKKASQILSKSADMILERYFPPK
jgi:uncharacterized protein YacL